MYLTAHTDVVFVKDFLNHLEIRIEDEEIKLRKELEHRRPEGEEETHNRNRRQVNRETLHKLEELRKLARESHETFVRGGHTHNAELVQKAEARLEALEEQLKELESN